MNDFAWALIGPGAIAHRFAAAVQGSEGTFLGHLWGRDARRASDFARRWTVDGRPTPRVAAGLDALLADPAIDAVYVAAPHSAHDELVRACLLAGKPVLCEKPLVPHLAAGRALTALARERGLFLMEALWTRFLPLYDGVGDWLRSGAIGRLQSIQSSFCFPAVEDPHSRLFNPALAGGALLDIGIYNLSMTRWAISIVLGACPPFSDLQVDGVPASTGVDARVLATLRFPGPITAQFVCGIDGAADNSLSLFGTEGSIRIAPTFWQATQATLTRPDGAEATLQRDFRINGFEYEIAESMRCIRAGLIESPRMDHTETLATLGWMDEIRRRLGVRYPFE